MKLLTVAIAVILLNGCVGQPDTPYVVVDLSTRPDVRPFVDDANSAAERVLKEFNSSDSSRRLGGPFKLSEYKTTVSETQSDGRPVVDVLYQLNKPVDFLGHPEHFVVSVYKDTREVNVFHGR